ncbi:iron ABC transporter [Chimaeribacter californicus]|uniref:Iron ABC transporter n=1 Tax=Chimaeribacter californicus TaxID=2060067 RepID=A0A2N5E7G8_9GAMM|nr:iron ABC transporter permease [Chimaeribacter californicus]PLR37430.1 iron ABC transporter [Chimaeribacter californicus]
MALSLAGLMLFAARSGALPLPLSLLWERQAAGQVWAIWFEIRLPRVLLAVMVGTALALAGSVMQGVFRNALADPGLLGVSSGAALAVAISVLLPLPLPSGLALYAPAFAAFIGSLLVTLAIFLLCRSGRQPMSRLLLAGIAINVLTGAITGLLSWLSSDQQLRQLALWGMGSLGQAQWPALWAVASLVIPASAALWGYARRLNLLQLGEEEAHYLGVPVRQTQAALLILSALLTAAAVAVSGIIGFIGLVIPHLARMVMGADHRALLPASALLGAMLLLLSDTVARTAVAPAEMPVGLLTSLIGAPWFLWLMIRRNRGQDE